jgi:hypothetical protein
MMAELMAKEEAVIAADLASVPSKRVVGERVRREKAPDFSGCRSHKGNWSLHPVANYRRRIPSRVKCRLCGRERQQTSKLDPVLTGHSAIDEQMGTQ